MFRVKTTHLLFSFVALYLLTCYYVYRAVDTQLARSSEYQKWRQNARPDEWPVLHIRRNQNGTWQFLQDECPVHTVIKHSHLSPDFAPVSIDKLPPDTCSSRPDPTYNQNDSVIIMEEEWKRLDVGYPQYVYTISGWIQVLQVESYTPKPALHVIIVPHSHQDVGWRITADSCYTSHAKPTLSNAVQKLAEHSNWKFIWAETAFLARWYKEASDDQKEALKRAISSGQLEIVTGGWVMTEEACAHYAPMLDQLTEGHLWLKEELVSQHIGKSFSIHLIDRALHRRVIPSRCLKAYAQSLGADKVLKCMRIYMSSIFTGIVPKFSWSVDPFGHSPTMAYLLGGAGVKNMVIQRVHFAIKRHLAKVQQLEFDWRQSWDETGTTDISCHMMPFLSYAILYSCGPDPHVCCQFDFTNSKCFRGKKAVDAVPVSDENIKKLSWALWEQFQKKAQLYRSNVILVPHGDDFRYDGISEWDKQLNNMEKLMKYMNADRDMNVKMEFGTISDYFKAVEADREKNKNDKTEPLPKLVGDFFPYNDRDDQYWTGFYSSRALYKYMARVLQAKLRCTEILYTMVYAQLMNPKGKDLLKTLGENYSNLQDARRDQATFMHHDAITGTSKTKVVTDYANMLHRAMNKVDSVFHLLLSLALTNSARSQELFQMNEQWLSATGPPVMHEAELSIRTLMVTNPQTMDWVYLVKVRVLEPNVRVVSSDGSMVRQQISPVWDQNMALSETVLEIVFEAEVPALSIKTYKLQVQQASTAGYVSVTLYSVDMDTFAHSTKHPFRIRKSAEEMFQIQNNMITATFSACTGTLQHIMRRSDDLGQKVGIKFMTYSTGSWSNPFKDKSGAYIFMPDGPARGMEGKYPKIIVVEGELSSSVYTYLSGVVHVSTLYNITGPLSSGVHVENTANMGDTSWNNRELVMRLVSDVINPNSDVCVDLNGFQMTRKQWRGKQLIQGNFHPVNTMAYIENTQLSRLTLVTAQAHGLASLNFGWMEVVLDRRMMQDDWRGMGEGVWDNHPTPSKFVILLEKRDTPYPKNHVPSSVCRPSLLAELTSQYLNNPPVVSLSQLDITTLNDQGLHSVLEAPLPCTYHLVNLRSMMEAGSEQLGALMVMQRVGVDCNFSEIHRQCLMTDQVQMKMFKGTQLWRAYQTSLTGHREETIPMSTKEIHIPDMELRTFKLIFS